jgi:hypothetical protein
MKQHKCHICGLRPNDNEKDLEHFFIKGRRIHLCLECMNEIASRKKLIDELKTKVKKIKAKK